MRPRHNWHSTELLSVSRKPGGSRLALLNASDNDIAIGRRGSTDKNARLTPKEIVVASLETPQIIFSPWKAWEKPYSLPGMVFSGVYLLAHLDDVPPGPADPQDERIVYIGQTCNLEKRLRKFGRAASTGKGKHSGGHTYNKEYGGIRDDLYVATFPVGSMDDRIRSAFIQYVERKLIWKYAQRWGALPVCNQE
jgi:hypothetical protein